ncbi:DUF262 domain-containing protein, partial [Streptomyces sp. P9(2023)]|uniref:DUF262 domain-containing protein n=1 Tax=Streptomyces sp. P9(2023) TaxID=3064394 RepID=UPI0037DDA327
TDNYCLQPIVVQCRGNDQNYELIDGQQRLTTLYLLYRFIHIEIGVDPEERFSISYETRPSSQEYLKNLDEKRKAENIDFYHMFSAYQCIK